MAVPLLLECMANPGGWVNGFTQLYMMILIRRLSFVLSGTICSLFVQIDWWSTHGFKKHLAEVRNH